MATDMAKLFSFIIAISFGMFFAGIFLPMGFTALTDYAGNLSGTNATLWGYLITFAIIGLLLYIVAPALREASGISKGFGKGA